MNTTDWKVVYRYQNGAETSHVVTGFLPLRQAIQDARTIPAIRIVEVGPKIGPALTTFGMMHNVDSEVVA